MAQMVHFWEQRFNRYREIPLEGESQRRFEAFQQICFREVKKYVFEDPLFKNTISTTIWMTYWVYLAISYSANSFVKFALYSNGNVLSCQKSNTGHRAYFGSFLRWNDCNMRGMLHLRNISTILAQPYGKTFTRGLKVIAWYLPYWQTFIRWIVPWRWLFCSEIVIFFAYHDFLCCPKDAHGKF